SCLTHSATGQGPEYRTKYGYDSLNRLTNMSDALGATGFTWTDGNLLAGEDGPWAADTVSYNYSHRQRGTLSLVQPNASP
ncbi:MAG TPA: hypothetical protein PKI20_21235, partial [Verrucomicrobiota bacterium]|nr:hypothetical protein [Verrucomicrobiota bacterium]